MLEVCVKTTAWKSMDRFFRLTLCIQIPAAVKGEKVLFH